MISILLNDTPLDLYSDTDITWSWTDFRFRDKLTDQYTNNFTIPKTENNIKALDIYSTLDSKDVQFGEEISPADFVLNGEVMSIYIQVISATDNEIEIAIFEDTFSAIDKQKVINDELIDDPSTILCWDMWSMTTYPNKFVSYNYGMSYNWHLAQRHPYVKLKRDILDNLDLKGYQIDPGVFNQYDWRILCSKKVVCPQNTTQVVQYRTTGYSLANNNIPCRCSQHITNDASYEVEEGVITFNRSCSFDLEFDFLWQKKNTFHQNSNIKVFIGGQQVYQMGMYSASATEAYKHFSLDNGGNHFSVNAGDTLFLRFEDANNFKSISIVMDIEYDQYEITEEDYGTELTYIDILPALYYVTNNAVSPNNYNWANFPMNGTTQNILGKTGTLKRLSFAYFGQYCNIPKMKLGDLLYSLQWMIGGELKEDRRRNLLYFDILPHIYPSSPYDNEIYMNEINKLEFHSDKVGKKNYIKYKDEEFPTAITTINNKWLEEEKVWHEVIFHYFNDNVINQYSLDITDEENVKLNFNDIENPVIFNYNNRVEPIPLKKFDMENIWFSKEIEFSFYDTPMQFRENHDIIIDGRIYYVISGEQDIEKKISTIRAILVQYNIPLISIDRIYAGRNHGDVNVVVNIQSDLPLKNAYLDYQKGFDATTLTRKQLNLQTGVQTVLISGLTSGTWIFVPKVENQMFNQFGMGRTFKIT